MVVYLYLNVALCTLFKTATEQARQRLGPSLRGIRTLTAKCWSTAILLSLGTFHFLSQLQTFPPVIITSDSVGVQSKVCVYLKVGVVAIWTTFFNMRFDASPFSRSISYGLHNSPLKLLFGFRGVYPHGMWCVILVVSSGSIPLVHTMIRLFDLLQIGLNARSSGTRDFCPTIPPLNLIASDVSDRWTVFGSGKIRRLGVALFAISIPVLSLPPWSFGFPPENLSSWISESIPPCGLPALTLRWSYLKSCTMASSTSPPLTCLIELLAVFGYVCGYSVVKTVMNELKVASSHHPAVALGLAGEAPPLNPLTGVLFSILFECG